VGVACGAGADTGPLNRINPSSVAAKRRRYLTVPPYFGPAAQRRVTANIYTLVEKGSQPANYLFTAGNSDIGIS
jgi:hypothetical protein